jgi:RNA polymerase sigma-70 factor, ECF subfamily
VIDRRDDRELAVAAAGGDRRALDALLHRHADLVHRVCRRVTGDPDDALDAAQEALIAVSRRIGSYDGRSQFTTWLYRVATNAALDELRRRGRRPRPDASLSGPMPTMVAGGSAGAGAAGLGGAVVRGPAEAVVARIDVDAALARLPEEFRVAVVLRDLGDLDYAEIAEVLGVPIGTVRSRIARGRAALATVLGNRDDAPRRPTS